MPSTLCNICFSMAAGVFELLFKPILVIGCWNPFVFRLFVTFVLSSIVPLGMDE